jgi:hypothetical protein
MTRRIITLLILSAIAVVVARPLHPRAAATICFPEYSQWYSEHKCHSGQGGETECEIP